MRQVSSNSHPGLIQPAVAVGSVEFNDLCISTRQRREEPPDAMTDLPTPPPGFHAVSRRRTLTGLAAAGVGVPLLAACGSDDPDTPADGGSDGGSDGGAGGDFPVATADIEVGGGSIFADQEVVVTQPTEGEFKAFSAVCTHQGCIVASISDGTINCDCHGSKFSIETGAPEDGPATSALDEVKITVTGDQISLA
jgi:Rieske Fe-S protein